MRALLISANTEQVNMTVLPLGLAQVAAATEQAGHDVRLLNLLSAAGPSNLGSYATTEGKADPADLENALRSFQPDVIGISVRNIDDQNMQAPRFLLEPVKKVVRACNEGCPGVPVVVGGAGYSIFPGPALAYLGADFGVRGEGEGALPALLSRIERGADAAALAGVYVSGQASAASAVPPACCTELDRFPAPDPRSWLTTTPPDSWVPVQSRRGCPLDCSYCSTASIEGRQVRRRSPDLVARDITRAREAGFRRFYFVDNTFNLPETYALRLCAELTRLALDIEWRCIVYPRVVSAELARTMREAGCVEVSIGFESGNERMLETLNKRFRTPDVRTTSERLADLGIRRNGFLLLGGPGETRQSIDESLAFADSLRLDMLSVRLGIRLYPGTPLHRTAIADGVVAEDDDLLRPRFYVARGLERVAEDLRERLHS